MAMMPIFLAVGAGLLLAGLFIAVRAALAHLEHRNLLWAISPVPPEIFYRAWQANADLVRLTIVHAAQANGQAALSKTVSQLRRCLKQQYPEHWQAILFRIGALIRLESSHPGPLARWTRPGDEAHRFHPTVLVVAATAPVTGNRFDATAFFDRLEQAAAQMENVQEGWDHEETNTAE